MQKTLADLRLVDHSWDYRRENTKSYTHGFHPYPAMMIPQVARRLIEGYGRPGDTVLDPFCGSGSVLVEAMLAGRNGWGIDLNPLALLIAKVKTTPIEPRRLEREYYALLGRLSELEPDDLARPSFPNLEFWFKELVIAQLAKLKPAIQGVPDMTVREFFQVVFSETVRLSSNSRSHEFKLYRYDAQRLEEHQPDVIKLFMERAERNILRMADFYRDCKGSTWVKLLLANTTEPTEIPPGSVDLVVTSPPYGDSRTTVAYGQFSRLSAQWLRLVEKGNLDSKLLGGRAAPTLDIELASPTLRDAIQRLAAIDNERTREVLSFYKDLARCMERIAQYVRSGGYLCFVMGNRRVKGIQLDTDLILAGLGQELGLVLQQIIVRSIPSKTMPLQNSPTNVRGAKEMTMHNEYIVIMRKR